jgi:large subunit ribosomal protein L30
MAVKKKYPMLNIKLVKSIIGRNEKQRAIVRGLGLTKLNSQVIREDRPEIRGMINKIVFMLEVSGVKK